MDDDRRLRFVRRQRRRRVAIRRPLRDRLNPLEEWDEEECYTYLRFSPQSVMWIVRLLADRLTRPTNRSGAIPALLQVVLALHYLASGAFLNVVRRMVHVSIPTASRVLWGFVSAVVNMRNNYIMWPTTPEAIRRAKQGFYALNSEYPSPVFVKYP